MKKIWIVSVGFALFLTLVTGSRVTSASGVDVGFTSLVALSMLSTALTCICIAFLSVRFAIALTKIVPAAFAVFCLCGFALSALHLFSLPTALMIGVGIGCGYASWGFLVSSCTKREIVVVAVVQSVVWSILSSLLTLVDVYSTRMAILVLVLLLCVGLYLFCGKGSAEGMDSSEAALEEEGGAPRSLPEVATTLSVTWRFILLVSVLGFASGIMRVLSSAAFADPMTLSFLRFLSGVLASLACFVLQTKRPSAFPTSSATLALLLVTASAFTLLPVVNVNYQVILAAIVDVAYLLAGLLVLISCVMAGRGSLVRTTFAWGIAQGVSVIFITAGFVLSFYLRTHAAASDSAIWLLVTIVSYVIVIILVVVNMPNLRQRNKSEDGTILMITSISEQDIRGNRGLIDVYHISSREMDVMILTLTGRNAASIAELLYLSESTVRTHLKHIYKKLDIHSKEELREFVEAHVTQSK